MEPFKPYGRPPMFNPRPMNTFQPTISAPFRPNMINQVPGYIPPPMNFAPKFRPHNVTISHPPVPLPIINNEIYLSVFIGSIPEGITDETFEQILKACGNIRSWKRVINSSGEKKNYGICEFEGFDVLLRALRVIGGEANKDLGKDENAGTIELPTQDEKNPMQHIIFKIDDSTRNYLKKNPKTRNPYDLDKDKESLKAINDIINKLIEENKKKLEESKKEEKPETKKNELSSEQNDLISKELSLLRNKAIHEKEKYELNEHEYERKRRRDEKDHDISRKRDYDSSSWRNDDYDEEEEEKRRQERREKEMEQAYKERVKRWENREYSKSKVYEMEQIEENSYLERQEKDKIMFMERLAHYDDDIERERGEHEYYYDRNRWWSHRKSYLLHENKEDEIDRRRELEELEEKAKSKSNEMEFEPAKENSALENNVDQENENKSNDQPMVVGRIMTVEERKLAVENLINSIPNDKEELWNWNIKWEYLDDTLVNEKIKPFVGKKIKEYFGEEDQDLVEFIIDILKSKNSAEQLYKELQPALAEEVEVFVKIIWRRLIFETESRHQGLN